MISVRTLEKSTFRSSEPVSRIAPSSSGVSGGTSMETSLPGRFAGLPQTSAGVFAAPSTTMVVFGNSWLMSENTFRAWARLSLVLSLTLWKSSMIHETPAAPRRRARCSAVRGASTTGEYDFSLLTVQDACDSAPATPGAPTEPLAPTVASSVCRTPVVALAPIWWNAEVSTSSYEVTASQLVTMRLRPRSAITRCARDDLPAPDSP
ncbi:hypothetical protein B8281_03195 [Cellulosimicrobium sp. TH-20]|nr:hypothetical protein B8281_03195 [Cellulosimicrobium sp. TH-20]